MLTRQEARMIKETGSNYDATWVNLGSINGDPTFESSTVMQDIVQFKG